MQTYIKKLDKIIEDNHSAEFIYRGQSDKSWDIKSTALRRLENSDIDINKANYDTYHKQLIQDAKKYKYHKEDDLSDIELLSKLQHNGASTGLIDFSLNFLIALWFASENESKDGVVFIVDINDNNIIKYDNKELFEKNNTLEEDKKHYFIDNRFINNNRISAQQGVFLFGYTSIENFKKIEINKEDKSKIKNYLKKMFYIDEEFLFQDIYGFSAINNIEHIVNKDLYKQNDDEKYFNKGNEYFYKGEYKEAIKSYEKSINNNSTNYEVYVNMGFAYDELKEYEKAIESYKKAIEINPKNYIVYNNVGLAYYKLNEYEKALESYKKAIEINPKYDSAYYNMGVNYIHLKEYKKAIESYKKVIEINPKNDIAYIGIGLNYSELKEYKKAIESYEKAIDINPKDKKEVLKTIKILKGLI